MVKILAKIGLKRMMICMGNNRAKKIWFTIIMLESILYDYSDACILVKGSATVANTAAADADANNTNQAVIFKNCTSFIKCIT